MTMIRISHGENRGDRTPGLLILSWAELCELWVAYAALPRHPSAKVEHCPFVSPFVMASGTIGKFKRSMVGSAAWFGVDVDAGWSLEAVARLLDGIPHFIHTTTNSR